MNEIEYAHHLLNLTNSHPLKYVSSDVYTGLAGIGLTNLFFWKETKSQTYIDEAVSSADYLIKSAQVNGDKLSWLAPDGNTYIGHAKGASGISIFLMYMYKITHDKRYLSASKKALNFEISFAIEKENFISFPGKTKGSLTYSPYWFSGSAGVGAALMRYKYLTKETEFDNIITKIINDSNRIYTLFPGLFNGLAGLGNLFLDAEQFLEESKYRENALKICDSLNMFTQERKQGLAFPGDYLSTINCDFGSGSSGIALFLNRLINKENNFNFYIDEFLF